MTRIVDRDRIEVAAPGGDGQVLRVHVAGLACGHTVPVPRLTEDQRRAWAVGRAVPCPLCRAASAKVMAASRRALADYRRCPGVGAVGWAPKP